MNENRRLKGSQVEHALRYASEFENYIIGFHKEPDGSNIQTSREKLDMWAKNNQIFGPMHSTIQSLSRGPLKPLVQMMYERSGLVSASSYQKGTKWGSREAGYMFWLRPGNIGKYLRHDINRIDYDSVLGGICG